MSETEAMGAATPEPVAPQPKSRSRLVVRIGIGLGVCLAIYGGLVFAVGREIPVGTTVNGVEIGRMTKADATEVLNNYAKTFATTQVSLTAHGEITQDTADNLGLALDVASTIDSINTSIYNPIEILSAFFGGQEVTPVIVADGALDGAISDIAASVDQPAVDAGINRSRNVTDRTI